MSLFKFLRLRSYTKICNEVQNNFMENNMFFTRLENVRMYSEDQPSTSLYEEEEFETSFAREIVGNPKTYKGLAFTPEERKLLRLRGILPPAVVPLDEQLKQFGKMFYSIEETDVTKYFGLMTLHDVNRKLFFNFFGQNVEKVLRILYAPTVSDISIDYTMTFSRPRCLYITINDKENVENILRNWPYKDIKLIIATDGEKVHGIGDFGVNSGIVCVVKSGLYTAVLGLNPLSCLPIVIDVGTDNETFLKGKLYNGLKQKRIRGDLYDQLIEEFMCSVQNVFGPRIVIHFENFGKTNTTKILQKYRNECCCYGNSTNLVAGSVISGLFSAAKILNKKIWDMKFVFFGAGECNMGIATFLNYVLLKHGVTEDEAKANMYLIDRKGMVTKDRQWDLNDIKLPFAKDVEPLKDLISIIKTYKPDVLIGASSTKGAFNKEILETMAKQVEQPVIFSLSNPLQKAECTAEEAIKYTYGRCVFASGYPFKPVNYNGKIYQISPSTTYFHHAIGMAACLVGIKSITDDILLKASCALEECVTKENLEARLIYPPLSKIRQVAVHMVLELMQYAYDNELATVLPEPADKKQFYLSNTYQLDYDNISSYEDMFQKAKGTHLKNSTRFRF